MARIDIRLSDEQKADLRLQAERAGKTLSEFTRDRLLGFGGDTAVQLGENQEALRDVVNDHESRLSRLEEMAGL